MPENDDLALTLIGAALIVAKAVEIHEYDRQLMDEILSAGGDINHLLRVPMLRQLRTLAHAIQTALCAPDSAIHATVEGEGDTARSEKCAHPSCGCRVAMGIAHWPYCGEHCKEAAGETELRCDCQHGPCRTASARAANLV